MPLEYAFAGPDDPADGALVIVLLHGRGSNRHDLVGLQRGLPSGALIVAPEAPFPAGPWGYGPGFAWYRYLGGDRPEPESFDRSQRELDAFLEGLGTKLPVRAGRIALGGFSQGGTMSLAFALRNPGALSHVLNFSGFLPDHPAVQVTPETVRGTRIFWGHGTQDQAIPFSMAESGRRALRAVGADLTAIDYPIGHWIDPDELATAAAWLEQEASRGDSATASAGRGA